MSMVERVARAIATELDADLDTAFANKTEWTNMRGTDAAGRWRDINEPFKSDYLAAARAAIEAMREPTGEMSREFFIAWTMAERVRERLGANYAVAHAWNRMIDAMLDDGTTAALGEGE